MKLLVDKNLSWRVALRLRDAFPASAHVRAFGPDTMSDEDIAQVAVRDDFVVATKDVDLVNLCEKYPTLRVVRLEIGNTPVAVPVDLLRRSAALLEERFSDDAAGFIILR